MLREVTFSPRKSVEAILFIANRLDGPTIHEVLKLLYFADKLHLERYGFLATGDEYVAMRFGPVASSTYDLIKAARGDKPGWYQQKFVELAQSAIDIAADRRTVLIKRASDQDALSDTQKECLEDAIAQYGGMDFDARTNLSHDAAWQQAWKLAEDDEIGQSPIPVTQIASTLDNADEVLAHLACA